MSVGVTTDQKQTNNKISRRKYGLNLMCDQEKSLTDSKEANE
jgi:hypothetical protein